MINKIFRIITGSFIFSSLCAHAGLEVQNNVTAEELVNNIVDVNGGGVTFSNPQLTGIHGMAGTFTGGKEILGFDEGIILSTGVVDLAEKTDSSAEASRKMGAPGDVAGDDSTETVGFLENYLNALNPDSKIVTNDAVVFEFDFTVSTDRVEFNYVFASEEYNQYVGRPFNDAFALFINGENVALIENAQGTQDVVSIATVNNGNEVAKLDPVNREYFVDNDNNLAYTDDYAGIPFIYSGYTLELTAVKEGLDLDKVHHMKFVIADVDSADYTSAVPDRNVDSAVFVKANSFKSDPPKPDNIGSEFLFSYLPNNVNDASSDIKPELYLTTETPTTVIVRYPAFGPENKFIYEEEFSLTPGEIKKVDLSSVVGGEDSVLAWTELDNGERIYKAGKHANNLVGVTNKNESSKREFIAYMHNSEPGNGEASMGIPTDVWGTEYVISSYFDDETDSGMQQFIVYSNTDNTNVEITAAGHLVTKISSGVPVALSRGQSQTVTLHEGEAFYAYSNDIQLANTSQIKESIAGTLIKSNNPVGVISGNRNVSINGSEVDSMFEILPATNTWGSEFLSSDLPNRSKGSDYQILASRNRTTLKQDGVAIAIIDKDTPFNIKGLTGEHYFSGEDALGNPVGILGMQFMTDAQGSALGAPAMSYIVPTSQFMSSYITAPTPAEQYAAQYTGVIAHTDELAGLSIDEQPVDAADFDLHSGVYSWANLSSAVSQKFNQSSSDPETAVGFALTMIGQSADSAYSYPAGAFLRAINLNADTAPPSCLLTNVVNYSLSGSANDKHNQESDEDINGDGYININTGFVNGTDFDAIRLSGDAVNLDFEVNPFDPGDLLVQFTLASTDKNLDASGDVIITDAQGNNVTCPVIIDGQGLPSVIARVSDYDPTGLDSSEFTAIEVEQGTAIWLDGRLSTDIILNNSGAIVSYQWDLVDSDGIDDVDLEGEVVEHVYENYGVYTATLTVTDDSGNKATAQVEINVLERFEPPIAIISTPDGKDGFDFNAEKVTRIDASLSHAAGYPEGEGISQYDFIIKRQSTDDEGNLIYGANNEPVYEIVEQRLGVTSPIQDFIFDEPGEYIVEVVVYDSSGTASETDPDSPQQSSEVTAKVYDQNFKASGSLAVYSTLFMLFVLAIRRRFKAL